MAAMAAEQRAKRAGAVAYDYEADPRWSEYLSNVLLCQQIWVPPAPAPAPANPDKNLEQKIKDSGDKLHSPPSSIEQLLPLLDVNGEIYNHEQLRKSLPNHKFRTGSDCEVASLSNLSYWMVLMYCHNMIVEDERDSYAGNYDYTDNCENINVSMPEIRRDRRNEHAEYIRNHFKVRNQGTKSRLKADLMEEIWNRFGANENGGANENDD